jgi:hypothetical protein
MGPLVRDPEEARGYAFIFGSKDKPPMANIDRLINAFRFIFLGYG